MARLLAWLADALVLYFIVRAIAGFLTGGRRTPGARQSPAQKPERSGGTLVRDSQCGTYIPESRALRLTAGGQTLYFCSAKCRDAYVGRTAGAER